jgi:hypothetical protein
MKDQGVWGGVQVEATLEDGTTPGRVVFFDPFFTDSE